MVVGTVQRPLGTEPKTAGAEVESETFGGRMPNAETLIRSRFVMRLKFFCDIIRL